jgi:aldehyde dehydrogenase (NAD+)
MTVLTDRPRPAFLAEQKKLLIRGDFVDSASNETFESVNPATGQVMATVAKGSTEDVNRAVAAAREAFDGDWRNTTPADRQRLLLTLADLIADNSEELALLDSLDVGLPTTRSRGAVETAAKSMAAYAAMCRTIRGATIENSISRDMITYTRREPVGVVGAITPWNSPVTSNVGKIGPALAAGCTMILKPAEQSPLSALRLGELCLEAGIPPGVVNVITGFGDAGAALAEHARVDKVSFTGSVETGQSIVRASAGNLKRLTLELGGKSPNIVFSDADLEQAVPAAAMSVFSLTGQFCAAGSRLFVESRIYDDFVQRVSDFARTLTVGDPLSPDTDLGPLVSDEQLAKVLTYIDLGREGGAELVTGGERLAGDYSDGYYIPPTIFAQVHNEMLIAREEIFGPVISAIPFESVEDVVTLANDTTYGLACGVWTNDVRKAHRLSVRLDAGMVWINTYGNYDKAVPFGGHKMSGLGLENGTEGIEQYLESKSIWINAT